jgi:hypothetical protein
MKLIGVVFIFVGEMHGLINYIDNKAKCRHPSSMTPPELLVTGDFHAKNRNFGRC